MPSNANDQISIIEVCDERAYLSRTPRLVGRHVNVPSQWTGRDIMKRFGIAEHLTVYRTIDGRRSVVHHGG